MSYKQTYFTHFSVVQVKSKSRLCQVKNIVYSMQSRQRKHYKVQLLTLEWYQILHPVYGVKNVTFLLYFTQRKHPNLTSIDKKSPDSNKFDSGLSSYLTYQL